MNTRDELERPMEWLRSLAEEPEAHRRLLEESGSLALAAYRLARARCRVRPVPASVPTAAELQVAAADLLAQADARMTGSLRELASDCEAAGLAVIAPHAAA